MTTLELEPLLTEVNKHLKANQKVHKDDPILANVLLNQVILERYVEALQTKLREAQLESATLGQQATKQAEAQVQHLMDQLDDHLERRIQSWEKQFKTQCENELFKIRAAALYAQIGGALVLVVGSLAAGLMIGNWLFP